MAETDLVLPDGWRIADAAESARLHVRAYGQAITRYLLPVGETDAVRFACLRCGHCCQRRLPGGEVITSAEAERLQEYARAQGLAEPVERRGRWRIPVGSDLRCAWLQGANECLVHAVKPHLCALAPIGVLLEHTQRVVAIAVKRRARRRTYDTRECLGIEAGLQRVAVADWLQQHGLAAMIAEADGDWQRQRDAEQTQQTG